MSDTSKDALLENLINMTSIQISKICDRDFAYEADRVETMPATGMQYLFVKKWPIVSISEILDNDVALTVNEDYYLSDEDKERGALYRPEFWRQETINGGLITNDPLAPTRAIQITYTGGYYLPSHESYETGADASLPLDISFVCSQIVASRYAKVNQGATGLKSMTEGGLSYSWDTGSATGAGKKYGLTDEQAAVLESYQRIVIA